MNLGDIALDANGNAIIDPATGQPVQASDVSTIGDMITKGMALLNSQQVVMVWQQGIPKGNRWDAQTVPVNVKQKGLYLVEATNGNRSHRLTSLQPIAAAWSPACKRPRPCCPCCRGNT